MKATTYQYFKDSFGRFYKKETDYANRSWWYVAEFDYGYTINWRICDGNPNKSLESCRYEEIFNA